MGNREQKDLAVVSPCPVFGVELWITRQYRAALEKFQILIYAIHLLFPSVHSPLFWSYFMPGNVADVPDYQYTSVNAFFFPS